MTIRCTGPDTGPIPRKSELSVTCDGQHGEVPPPVFALIGDSVTFYARAVAAGWLMANDLHLCPICRAARRSR